MERGPHARLATSRVVAARPALDELYASFNDPDNVADPVQRVRRVPDVEDREVVAFLSAGLAFGRVASVLASIDRVLDVVGDRPADFLRTMDVMRTREALASFVHRWIRPADIVALLVVLRTMILEAGSIERFFSRGLDPTQEDVARALEGFSTSALTIDVSAAYGRDVHSPGVAYFFSRPSSGAACKRLNLFLRWMVRRDGVDPGGWTRVPARQLVVPLDTHVVRVAQCLALTRYRSPGWRMAADITRSLRTLSPDDPVRYDFSLCHIGMMNACGFGRSGVDTACPLRGACRPAARRRAPFRTPSARR